MSRKGGHPSTYTPALARRVLRFLEAGGTRHGLDATPGLPAWSTFRRWMGARPALRAAYQQMMVDREDAFIDQIVDLARNATAANVAAVEVMIQTLRRLAARRNPRFFSERVIAQQLRAARANAHARIKRRV